MDDFGNVQRVFSSVRFRYSTTSIFNTTLWSKCNAMRNMVAYTKEQHENDKASLNKANGHVAVPESVRTKLPSGFRIPQR
jgi:hypothetical protein